MKVCPICKAENTGGKPHRWHKVAHRQKGYTTEMLTEMVSQTIQRNQVKAIVSEAVDLARQPDHWTPKPSRREYHRAYYWRHVEKRRRQRNVAKRMRAKLQPLISDLCVAVDLGRISARW